MDLYESLKNYYPKEIIDDLKKSENLIENKGLFLNTDKINSIDFEQLYPNIKKHPIVPNSYIYKKGDFDLGNSYLETCGAIYIQDPSASLVPYYLNPTSSDRVLDLCAAPGGKTLLSSILMKNEGLIVANDISKSRANILLSNVERLGRKNIVVTSLDFSKLYENYEGFFTKIILDAPCSGSGMFRKEEKMKNDWSIEKVKRCAIEQKNLINIAFKMLAPGGTLSYSTCSYSIEENENIILEFLNENKNANIEVLPENSLHFTHILKNNIKGAIHLLPTIFPGEGHFICLIKKDGNLGEQKVSYDEEITINKFTSYGDKIIEKFIYPSVTPDSLLKLALRPGLHVSTIQKKIEIPSHHYSHYQNSDESIVLNDEEFSKYIKGYEINKKTQLSGFTFVSYKGLNVGVVKVNNISEVLKNFYPKGLRH